MGTFLEGERPGGRELQKKAEKYLVLVFTALKTFIAAECTFVVLADIYKSFVSL